MAVQDLGVVNLVQREENRRFSLVHAAPFHPIAQLLASGLHGRNSKRIAKFVSTKIDQKMHDELSSYGVSSYPPMKAQRMLAENIAALLRARGQKQKDLAVWCRHSEVWISAILSGKRSAHMKDLDRVADFFGIATYQLFQPGISRFTERRVGKERRTGHDRRVGHTFRIMGEVASDIESIRKRLNEKRGASNEKTKRA